MTQEAAPEWLTVAEVAAKLELSKMTVYRMIHERSLKAYKFGRAYRVKPADYDEYVEKSQIS